MEQLKSRIDDLSVWLVRQRRAELPLNGPGLDAHIQLVSETVLELHRLEPSLSVLVTVHNSIRAVVTEDMLELDKERFKEEFTRMVNNRSNIAKYLNKPDYVLSDHKTVYESLCRSISEQFADKISNDVCNALDAIVKPAIARQVSLQVEALAVA